MMNNKIQDLLSKSEQAQVESTQTNEPTVENTTSAPESVEGSPEGEVAPSAETAVDTKDTEPERHSVIEDWDSGDQTSSVETSPFELLSKELNYSVNGTNDIVALFKAKDAELKELKTKVESSDTSSYDALPAPLKEAIEIAKNGGDYLQMFEATAIDYNQLDAVDLYRDYLAQELGSVEDAESALMEMSDIQRKLEATRYKKQLINAQESRKADLAQKTAKEKLENTERLSEALNKFNDVQGFKVHERDKKQIHDAVTKGTAVKDLLYGKDGKVDYEKVARLHFLNNNFEKIVGYLRTNAKNETKREIVNSIANKTIERNPEVNTLSAKDDESTKLINSLKARRGVPI